MRDLIGRLFRSFAPRVLRDARTRSVLLRRARDLAHRADRVEDLPALWRLLSEYPEFLPLQRTHEILPFLELLRALRPHRVGEIGTASGGTAFLLARVAAPGAIIVTLDLSLRPGQPEALQLLAGGTRTIRSLAGDSHDPRTVDRVRAAADGAPFDALLIDGDHRYEGVAADFAAYRSLVRPGGVIAFHDIMQDSKGRTGIDTGTDAGGVPRFWGELRARLPEATSQIIEDPEQDACGIGVLRTP